MPPLTRMRPTNATPSGSRRARTLTPRFGLGSAGCTPNPAATGWTGWQTAARPCLALVIALDQLPRNLFRGTPAAFGTDPQARRIYQHGLEKNYLAQFTPPEQAFFLMPLQHAEDIALQEESVRRCQALLAQAPSDWRTVLSS